MKPHDLDDYKPFILAFIISVLLVIFAGCQKEDMTTVFVTGNGVAKCRTELDILSDWVYKIGDTAVLRHTPGLETMALSGNVNPLDDEWCNIGTRTRRIPNNLDDDPEGDGYASQLVLFDYIIAMYHPTTYPDHFITYNWKDGSWIRWDLGNSPTIFRQSN